MYSKIKTTPLGRIHVSNIFAFFPYYNFLKKIFVINKYIIYNIIVYDF